MRGSLVRIQQGAQRSISYPAPGGRLAPVATSSKAELAIVNRVVGGSSPPWSAARAGLALLRRRPCNAGRRLACTVGGWHQFLLHYWFSGGGNLTLSRALTPGMVADYADSFEDAFEMNHETGCWDWVRYRDKEGYGRFGFGSKNAMAHRAAYALEVGAIPEGMDIDHLCRNRGCVNPEHLEIVTRQENLRRQHAWYIEAKELERAA